jgi:LPS sulfotransferase NodH
MAPGKSYIICATPRTGSFLLCEALIRAGVAGGPGEYFWMGNEEGLRSQWGVTTYAEYVQVAIRQGSTSNGVFGAKIMHGYLEDVARKVSALAPFNGRGLRPDQAFAELFPDLHYIWITRRDKVRQAISWYRAGATGIWSCDHDPPAHLDTAPTYDFNKIESDVRLIALQEALWNEFFRAAGTTPLSVVYEDLAADIGETTRRVLSFLEIPAPEPLMAIPGRMRRQSDALSEEWYARFFTDSLRPRQT